MPRTDTNGQAGDNRSPDAVPAAPGPAPGNAPDAGDSLVAADWSQVRAWRKAKRQALIAARLSISPVERAAHAQVVGSELTALLRGLGGRLLGFYWPFKGEYDPRPLVRALHADGMKLALPVVTEKARPLIFRPWQPGMQMAPGIWNIPVPASGEPVAPDVLLAPVVGFDSQGFRLGYGGGYYDRTLAAAPRRPTVIGIGFAIGEVPTIYPQPHDIPMDVIVTERVVLDRRRGE